MLMNTESCTLVKKVRGIVQRNGTTRTKGTLWKGGRFWFVLKKKNLFLYKTSSLLKSFRHLGTSGKEKRTSNYFKSILFSKTETKRVKRETKSLIEISQKLKKDFCVKMFSLQPPCLGRDFCSHTEISFGSVYRVEETEEDTYKFNREGSSDILKQTPKSFVNSERDKFKVNK